MKPSSILLSEIQRNMPKQAVTWFRSTFAEDWNFGVWSDSCLLGMFMCEEGRKHIGTFWSKFYIDKVIIDGWNLSYTNLRGLDLFKAEIKDAKFRDSDLSNSSLSGCRFYGCDFTGANAENARFYSCFFENCSFSDSFMKEATFIGSSIKP